jgi:hypothetical protein
MEAISYEVHRPGAFWPWGKPAILADPCRHNYKLVKSQNNRLSVHRKGASNGTSGDDSPPQPAGRGDALAMMDRAAAQGRGCYTTASQSDINGYTFEKIAGYVFANAAPGTVPLFHLYGTSIAH